jgi:hypothetical protein
MVINLKTAKALGLSYRPGCCPSPTRFKRRFSKQAQLFADQSH